MNAVGLGLCRTPARTTIVLSSTGDRNANKQHHKGRQKECTHPRSRDLGHTDYIGRNSYSYASRIIVSIDTATLSGKWQA